jgi:DNA (cytosine-5)-methyltransferase 1
LQAEKMDRRKSVVTSADHPNPKVTPTLTMETKKMNDLIHGDLFSGVGGFSLAAQWVGGIKTTQMVEINRAVHPVLNQHFDAPIHDDITTFNPLSTTRFDLFTAGFPCQDISAANPNGAGLDGQRSGLFFEIIRLLRSHRPSYVVLENVPALLSRNGGRDMGSVLWHLADCGYDAEWDVLPASIVGANHLRRRLWIVAYTNSDRRSEQIGSPSNTDKKRDYPARLEVWETERRSTVSSPALFWPPRSSGISTIPRMDDGLSAKLDKRNSRQGRN